MQKIVYCGSAEDLQSLFESVNEVKAEYGLEMNIRESFYVMIEKTHQT